MSYPYMLQSPDARAILVDLLLNGDNAPSNIAENTDYHSKSVQKRLKELEKDGFIENKGSGVYTLTLEGIATARTIRQVSDI